MKTPPQTLWWLLLTLLVAWGLWGRYGGGGVWEKEYFAHNEPRVGDTLLPPDLLENLQSVSLESQAGMWEFSKGRGNRFWLREPLPLPVDKSVLQSFLIDLQSCRVLEKVADQAKTRFQLDALNLTVNSARGILLDLKVGTAHFLGGHYIAFAGDKAVYRARLPDFPKDVFNWLDKRPLRGLATQAMLLHVGFGLRGSLSFVRDSRASTWRLNTPTLQPSSLDSQKVQSLLNRLDALAFGDILVKNDTRVQAALNHARFYQIENSQKESFQIWVGRLTAKDTLAERPVDFIALMLPPSCLYHHLAKNFIFALDPRLVKDLPYFPLDFSLKKNR